jgi:hypothetical protein
LEYRERILAEGIADLLIRAVDVVVTANLTLLTHLEYPGAT